MGRLKVLALIGYHLCENDKQRTLRPSFISVISLAARLLYCRVELCNVVWKEPNCMQGPFHIMSTDSKAVDRGEAADSPGMNLIPVPAPVTDINPNTAAVLLVYTA